MGRFSPGEVRFAAHGIRLRVASNWPPFLRLVSANYGAFPGGGDISESVDVRVTWERRPWFSGGHRPSAVGSGERMWGAGIVSDSNSVRFISDRTTIEVVDGPSVSVRASYVLDRRARLRELYRGSSFWEECQRLMRLTVHLPVLHRLEVRGNSLLHAAGVASPSGALVFAGLNGSGKSSLCFRLLGPFGYMSDNFVLWNGRDLVAFPEALRIPRAAGEPLPPGTPVVFGKKVVPVGQDKVVVRARPRAIFILTRGPKMRANPLSPGETARLISRVSDVTHEFPRHTYLGPIAMPEDSGAIIALAHAAPGYLLTMADLDETRAWILERFPPRE